MFSDKHVIKQSFYSKQWNVESAIQVIIALLNINLHIIISKNSLFKKN